jgi:4-hydroxyphenylpyruvate dioxygenase-like putative hemolysin
MYTDQDEIDRKRGQEICIRFFSDPEAGRLFTESVNRSLEQKLGPEGYAEYQRKLAEIKARPDVMK